MSASVIAGPIIEEEVGAEGPLEPKVLVQRMNK